MPTIPQIQDQEQLQVGVGRQRVQASPDAFGAQEARATGAVAQGLDKVGQVALEIDDDFNEAEALELDNELSRRMRDRLYNPESGYLATQRGRNAVDGRGQVEADIDTMVNELAGTARNERSAALFRSVAGRRAASAYGDVATYASQQSRLYQNEQSEGRINEAVDNAVAAYEDPAVVQANMNTAVAELERLREREGWSPEAYQSRVRRLQSDMSTRVIVSLAATNPEAAQEMYERIRPQLGAQEAGELLTTMRAAQREAEDGAIDEAWTYVAGGQRIPPDVWQRVPGRARIDIQNEQRRRAEGGSGAGDRNLIDALDIMPDEEFARADLWAVKGALGSNFRRMAERQRSVREGDQSADVTDRRTRYNALLDIAGTTLGIDLSAGERNPDRERATAYSAALLRETEAFFAANPGAPIDNETAQVLIGRAYVAMRGDGVSHLQGRVEGDRGRARDTRVRATTEVNVPFDSIDASLREQIRLGLRRRIGANPTRGEVENAYAAFLNRRPNETADDVYRRILNVGGGE